MSHCELNQSKMTPKHNYKTANIFCLTFSVKPRILENRTVPTFLNYYIVSKFLRIFNKESLQKSRFHANIILRYIVW